MKTEKIAFNIPEDLLASLKMGVKGLECEMRIFLARHYFKTEFRGLNCLKVTKVS